MRKQWLKRDKTLTDTLKVLSDYLRYTFTPAFSLVLLICGLGAFAIMTILFYRFEPLMAVLIFCSYAGFLLVVMVASFRKWKRYKEFYNSRQRSLEKCCGRCNGVDDICIVDRIGK